MVKPRPSRWARKATIEALRVVLFTLECWDHTCDRNEKETSTD